MGIMDETEREKMRLWVNNWKELGPILEELRLKSIRESEASKSILQLDGASPSLAELKYEPEIVDRLEQIRKQYK